MNLLQPTTFLFQGDSITDAGRNREMTLVNRIQPLGCGYVSRIAGDLMDKHPDADFTFLNRGVSGNRITDLMARWRVDAIHLSPTWISVLIGVNDTWHHYGSDRGTSLNVYETLYRLLLEETLKELPHARFVLCEPFALPVSDFKAEWMDNIKARAAIVECLAKEFNTPFVPFQRYFDAATQEAPAAFWLPDGVHPSPAGHRRMAEWWRQATGW